MRNFAAILLLTFTACLSRSQLSPLCDAARAGDAAQIKALVAQGADPNAPSGDNGWTPLLHAVHKHQNASIAALLDAGADVNRGNVTPLMFAASYGYDDTVTLLLARGAKVDAQTFDWALGGISDVDRFTLFQCQDSTVRLIRNAAPNVKPSPSAQRWARIKGCSASS